MLEKTQGRHFKSLLERFIYRHSLTKPYPFYDTKNNPKIVIAYLSPLGLMFISAVSLPGNKISNTEDEQEYRDRVERIRKLGGDSWLGLLNEIHNENKAQINVS